MKKFLASVLTAIAIAGCAGVRVPNYIQAEHPYERTVYGSFDEVVTAVRDVLKDEGWTIAKETHPAIFERNATYTEDDKGHLLIFTNIRKSSRMVYAKYSHLNVYIHQTKEGIKVDVRYGGITDLRAKKIHSYRNDKMAERLLNLIEQKLLLKK